MHACMHTCRQRQTGTDRNRHRQAETDEDIQRLKDIHTLQVNYITLYYIASHHINYITSHYSTVHTYKLQYICIHYSIFVYMCHTCHMPCDRQTHALADQGHP